MDELKKARQTMDATIRHMANHSAGISEIQNGLLIAIADASIAQVEAAQEQVIATREQTAQLKRVADATERRNELLAEFNEHNKTAAIAHTEKMAESINAFLDATYGKVE